MKLYLIRHGIAADRTEYTDDEARPLTDHGRERTRQVAQRLYDLGIRLDLILTSPLLRARQTAEILHKVGVSRHLEEFSPLAPDGEIQEWISWRSHHPQDEQELALVGHQPDLGNWGETFVWGSPKDHLILKKAGVIGLNLPETGTPIGNSEMFLLISPKWLL